MLFRAFVRMLTMLTMIYLFETFRPTNSEISTIRQLTNYTAAVWRYILADPWSPSASSER